MRNNYARRFRQFRHHSKRINQLLESGAFQRLSKDRQNRLMQRLHRLLHALRGQVAGTRLRRALGAAALLLGLNLPAQAQHTPAFTAPVQNAFSISNVSKWPMATIKDIDADGDLDIMMGSDNGDFQFHMNTGTATNPVFGAPVANPFGLSSVNNWSAPALVDIDDDGDLDMFVGENNGNMQYFPNTGTAMAPAFGMPMQNPFGIVNSGIYWTPTFADMDDDGDYDAFNMTGPGTLYYVENIGDSVSPNFTTPVANPWGIATVTGGNYGKVAAADFDRDGDIDLIIGRYNGSISFYENTGTASVPAFGPAQLSPFGLVPLTTYNIPEAADMDADGDYDLWVGDYSNNFWYFEDTATCFLPLPGFGSSANQLTVSFSDSTAGASSLLWDFGDGNSDTTQNPVHSYAMPGTYVVCLTATNLCGSDTLCDTLTVSCPPPQAAFSFTTFGDSASFSNSGTGTAWTWDFGDGSSSMLQNPSHVYATAGNYTVCLIASDSCGADTSCQALTIVGLDAGLQGNSIRAYPNPAEAQLHVATGLPAGTPLRLRLLDVQGRTLNASDAQLTDAEGKLTLDVTVLPAGMYFLELRTDQGVRAVRFLRK